MDYIKVVDVIVTWQTCDDECPAAEYYRIIARKETDIGRVELVRQQRVDGEWVDDETIGVPGIGGSYSLEANSPPETNTNSNDMTPGDTELKRLMDEIHREHRAFEAFLHGVVVGGEIYDKGVLEEDFNAYVRREWREYLDAE